MLHAKDPNPTGILVREAPDRRERAPGVLVVVVDEEEMSASGSVHRLVARGVADIAGVVAEDEEFVTGLEL
jgi:hypothetical protein